MATCIDPVYPLAQSLLDCLKTTFTDCGVPFCSASLRPGQAAAWDYCCECAQGEGQLWVLVQSIISSDDEVPETCTNEFEVTFQIGAIRCAPSIDSRGNPPTDTQQTNTFIKISKDAAIIREAVVCCWAANNDFDPHQMNFEEYVPLGPEGACVGGTQTVRVNFFDCQCN